MDVTFAFLGALCVLGGRILFLLMEPRGIASRITEVGRRHYETPVKLGVFVDSQHWLNVGRGPFLRHFPKTLGQVRHRTPWRLLTDHPSGIHQTLYEAIETYTRYAKQADRYGRRLFDLVFDALDQVHARLAPMLAAAPYAFTAARPKGSSNLTCGKRTRIKTLAADGVSVSEIARVVGVSRQTVYRWMPREPGVATAQVR